MRHENASDLSLRLSAKKDLESNDLGASRRAPSIFLPFREVGEIKGRMSRRRQAADNVRKRELERRIPV
jgi:hypothetical protein